MRTTTETGGQQELRLRVMQRVASEWNLHDVDYAVASGLENFPNPGRDLDVMVARRDLERAAQLASDTLGSLGFRVTVPPNPWGALWVFGFSQNQSLEIDLITRLTWGPAVVVKGPNRTGCIGPFAIDHWANFAKRVLMRGLGGFAPKRPLLQSFETRTVRDGYARLFGRRLEDDRSLLQAQGSPALSELVSTLRARLIRRCLVRRPWELLSVVGDWALREIRPHWTICAPLVAFSRTDLERNARIIRRVAAKLPEVFTGFRIEDWPSADDPRELSSRLFGSGLKRFLYHYAFDRFDSSRLQVVFNNGWPAPAHLTLARQGRFGESLQSRRFLRSEPDLFVDPPPEKSEEEIADRIRELLVEIFLDKSDPRYEKPRGEPIVSERDPARAPLNRMFQ